jgi:hypothetical protein
LNRFDEERSEFGYRIEDVRKFLSKMRSNQLDSYSGRDKREVGEGTDKAAFSAIAKS